MPHFIGYALFFMMLFVPTAYQLPKAILLALLLGMIVSRGLNCGRLFLHSTVHLWTLFFVVVGLVFILRGVLNDAPGALNVATVYVLWPIVYTFLITGVTDENVMSRLLGVMVIATFAITLYSLSFILNSSGWLSDSFYIPLYEIEKQGILFYEGTMELSVVSMSSFLFLIPLLAATLLTWPKNMELPVPRFLFWIALSFGLVVVMLSGRRALQLVVVLSPVITIIFRCFLPKRDQRVSRNYSFVKTFAGIITVLIGLLIYLNAVYDFSLQNTLELYNAGFDFAGDRSASARADQFIALLSGWAENPLIGAGHGATAAVLRSSTHPWAYELSYVALLFHVGLLGVLAYTAGVIWIYWMGIRVIRSGDKLGVYMLPVLVGMSCFLIGNATNPYLEKYDYMWVIFLPVALVNLWLLRKKRASAVRYESSI